MSGLLTLGSAPDILNREWSYQLLSYLNSDQLPLQRHTLNLNFPIKSTPYTHVHTLTTFDTMSCKYSGSGQTQITPPKFRVIPADPQLHSGHLFALSSISIWDRLSYNGCDTSLRVGLSFNLIICLNSNLISTLNLAFSGLQFNLIFSDCTKKWSWRCQNSHRNLIWIVIKAGVRNNRSWMSVHRDGPVDQPADRLTLLSVEPCH